MNNNKKSWLNKNLLGFGLTSLFNDFSFEMTTAILPMFIEQLVGVQKAPPMIGLIGGISDAASSMMKIWSGIIADRVKYYKFFLIIGYSLTPLFNGLIGLAKNSWQLLIYKTIAWMGRGMREPMRDKWITEIEHPSHYGKAFGFNRLFDTIGAIIGPLTAYFCLKFVSLKTIFLFSFIPGIISVLCLIFLTQQESVKKKIHTFNNWRNQLKSLPKQFNYFVCIMFIFGIGNFNKMLIIYRAQELLTGYAPTAIVATGWSILLYALFNVIRAFSEFSFGALSDYMSKKNILAVIGFGLFAITNIFLLLSTKSIVVWILIFIFAGMSAGTVTSLEKSYSAFLLPENVRGTGFGVLQMIDGIGDLISSIVVGSLWSFISAEAGFLYALIFSFFSMILLFFFRDT